MTLDPRLAARCRHLRMTMGARPGVGLVNLCQHIVRDGMECVGPFMDDYSTACGFWEPAPRDQPVAAGR